MIFNLSKQNIISHRPYFNKGLLSSIRCMVKFNFSQFDAFVFQDTNYFHTFFLKVPIDILFVDSQNSICRIIENAHYWSLYLKTENTVSIVSIPAGNAKHANIEVKDKLNFNGELTHEVKNKFKTIMPIIDVLPEAIPLDKSNLNRR